jgi:precorrin-6A/cobalt-precorrin-6A reductase
MLRMFDCRGLVTKDSGDSGGLRDKLDAAGDTGARAVVIRRARHEQGLSLKEVIELLTGEAEKGETDG